VKVCAAQGSGRLLGGQIVGIEGATKRIDVLATALYAGLTVPIPSPKLANVHGLL
jgi:hypothetical protein